MYTRYQLQTPVCALEWLAVLPDSELLQNMENVGYCFSLYQVWESFRPKLTLKSLLLWLTGRMTDSQASELKRDEQEYEARMEALNETTND